MKNGTLRGHVLSNSKPNNNVHVTAEMFVIILAKLTMNAVNDFRRPGYRNKVEGHFMRSYIKRSVTQYTDLHPMTWCGVTDVLAILGLQARDKAATVDGQYNFFSKFT